MQTIESSEEAARISTSPPPLNIPFDRVRSELSRIAQDPATPKPVANALVASLWFLNVDAFRQQEEELLIAGKYEQGRNAHRFMLANLIGDGERVLLTLLQTGLAEGPGGFSTADVKATLDSLHTAFHCEYGPKNTPQINQLIEGLFDVPAAGN